MVHDFDKPSRTDRVEPQDAEQKPAPRQSDRTETARQPARQDEEEPGKGRDDDLEIPSFLR
jgi:hypothetical protein